MKLRGIFREKTPQQTSRVEVQIRRGLEVRMICRPHKILSVFSSLLLAAAAVLATAAFAPMTIDSSIDSSVDSPEEATAKTDDRSPLNLTLPMPLMALKHFDLNVEIFSGTAWTEAIIATKVLEINRVYAACNVAIGALNVHTIAPPTGELNLYRDLEIKGSGGLHDAVVALGRTATLTLMLIRQFQEGTGGTAGIPSVYDTSLPEMVNRAWVTEETLEPTYVADRDPNYVPEAHELGHILLNAGHVTGRKNLMADDYRLVNGELEFSQCASIRSSPLVY